MRSEFARNVEWEKDEHAYSIFYTLPTPTVQIWNFQSNNQTQVSEVDTEEQNVN